METQKKREKKNKTKTKTNRKKPSKTNRQTNKETNNSINDEHTLISNLQVTNSLKVDFTEIAWEVVWILNFHF